MVHTVIMPKLGQTVEESTVVKWHKRIGDPVTKGEILFEIETDKAVLEIESFFEGTLLKIIVPEGETVPVATPVAFIGQPGDPIPEVVPVPKQKPAATATPIPGKPRSPMEGKPGLAAPPPVPSPAEGPLPPTPLKKTISPRARRLIQEHPINPALIPGSGPGGRVTEKDVITYLDAHQYHNIRITPAAKSLALKEGIDILSLERPDDRITVDMIRRAIAEKPTEMSKMRQIIARRMTQSFTTTPHFYVTVSVDTTDLLNLREKLKKSDNVYTITDFIMKSVALALKEFPAVNSTTDGRTIRWHSRIHLGMAVEVKDGLVVPVIRDADDISLDELHQRRTTLVMKAREGKLMPDEMRGSTFTVSNMGMLGVDHFTAIIAPGESAILAVSSIRPLPVVIKEAVVIRSMMNMTLSSDHRMVDGATAARFLSHIKSLLEDMELWKSMM